MLRAPHIKKSAERPSRSTDHMETKTVYHHLLVAPYFGCPPSSSVPSPRHAHVPRHPAAGTDSHWHPSTESNSVSPILMGGLTATGPRQMVEGHQL